MISINEEDIYDQIIRIYWPKLFKIDLHESL